MESAKEPGAVNEPRSPPDDTVLLSSCEHAFFLPSKVHHYSRGKDASSPRRLRVSVGRAASPRVGPSLGVFEDPTLAEPVVLGAFLVVSQHREGFAEFVKIHGVAADVRVSRLSRLPVRSVDGFAVAVPHHA